MQPNQLVAGGGKVESECWIRGKECVAEWHGMVWHGIVHSGIVVVYEDGMLRWSRGPEIGKQ